MDVSYANGLFMFVFCILNDLYEVLKYNSDVGVVHVLVHHMLCCIMHIEWPLRSVKI